LELLIIDGKFKLLNIKIRGEELLEELGYFLNFFISVMCSIIDEEACSLVFLFTVTGDTQPANKAQPSCS
jgi:hypothetical protein